MVHCLALLSQTLSPFGRWDVQQWVDVDSEMEVREVQADADEDVKVDVEVVQKAG